jgi:hypothetical protein
VGARPTLKTIVYTVTATAAQPKVVNRMLVRQ